MTIFATEAHTPIYQRVLSLLQEQKEYSEAQLAMSIATDTPNLPFIITFLQTTLSYLQGTVVNNHEVKELATQIDTSSLNTLLLLCLSQTERTKSKKPLEITSLLSLLTSTPNDHHVIRTEIAKQYYTVTDEKGLIKECRQLLSEEIDQEKRNLLEHLITILTSDIQRRES